MGAVGIRLSQCGKTFADGTRALSPVDLDIRAGETIVFLGPSGCGKTTLLRLIAGLERPDFGGAVLFNDLDVTALPIERRGIGMVFQSYALFPNMNVAQNVGYGLKLQGLAAGPRTRRVAELLEMVGMAELANRAIDQLSGGQRQRVALARALAPNPRALLLDEPLTALDAKLRDHLRGEIDRLLRAVGVTAIYVTHDQAEALALADRVVVMDRGRIAQIGTPAEVYFQPSEAFVAEFVGICNRLHSETGPPICFRPEHARLVPPGQGHIDGHGTRAEFQGNRVRVTVETVHGTVLVDTTVEAAPPINTAVGVAVDRELPIGE